jgi:hypothetical protein
MLACLTAELPAADVMVNGAPLDAGTRQTLEGIYRTRIAPGRYWYDAVSGAWGIEGGPAAGQMAPGLKLGGALRPDASGGGTGVFVNGRELHPLDVAALQRCAPVVRGRYWVLASGIGGVEGGPPQFNLAALCNQGSPGGSSMRCEDYGGGRFNCSNQRTGTGIISEGGGKAGVSIDGKYVLTPN